MMKVRNSLTNWRPWVGVLAVGVLTFGISLEGATSSKISSESSASRKKIRTVENLQITETSVSQVTSSSSGQVIAGVPARVVFSQMPLNLGDIPIAETIVVNPYDDIGDKWRLETGNTGPMPTLRELRMSRAGVAAGECSFSIECQDGDPCTENLCDILPGSPVGSGKCQITYLLAGQKGDCDDGILCNGVETCQGGDPGNEISGSCESPGDPCTGGKVCSESLSQQNVIAGQLAPLCHAPCSNDSECTTFFNLEALGCDGDETCDGNGVCQAGSNPCGSGADCLEQVCQDCGPGCNRTRACEDAGDCIGDLGEIGTCDGGLACFVGRCCTTGDGGVTYDCLAKKLGGAQGCAGLWYAGDGGRLASSCGPSSGGCPKYGSGIAPSGDFVRLVGPISASPVVIGDPDGTLTGDIDLSGPGVAFHKMGDDYTLSNDPSFMNLQVVRLVGGMIVADRLSVEIYDENQNFVQDFFFSISDDIIAVRTIEFAPPIVIPSKGFVVTRIASRFSFEAQWVWMTTNAVDVGANNINVIWVNDGPTTTSFLGTEVMAFEMVGLGDADLGGSDKVSAPVGACCNGDTGACNDLLAWECRGDGDNFVGLSTTCAACGDDTFLFNAACRTCDSGANVGDPCINDGECDGGFCELNDSLCKTCDLDSDEAGDLCVDSSNCTNGLCTGTCVSTDACTTGACCQLDGTCTENETKTSCAGGICRLGTGDGDACSVDGDCGGGTCVDRFQGFGLDCNPNCCYQPQDKYRDPLGDLNADGDADGPWSGGDSCEDAFVHVVPIVPGDPPTIITITGDNSNATNTSANPDTCLNFEEDPESDRGWWESFSIDACAFVWWDVCCTSCDGGCQPGPVVMFDSCDSGNGTCPTNVISRTNTNIDCLTSRFVRGLHSCPTDKFQGCEARDNITMFHGPLPAGTYYIPFLSDLSSVNGEYQMHITIDPCPVAACCTNNAGNTSSDCELTDILNCESNGGFFHGPPNRTTATVVCDDTPGTGTCETGSCCIGPGRCIDRDGNTDPFSISTCSGTYVGGVPCAGGICTADTSISCNDDDDCGLDGPCLGDEAELAQPNPCPVCEFQGLNNCQLFDNLEFSALPSDRGMPGAMTLADDFIPGGDTISKVCIWGFYLRVTEPGAPIVDDDCDDDVGGLDNFKVRIYKDSNNLPGDLFAESTVTSYVKTALEVDTALTGFDTPVDTYGVQMILDTEVTGLNPTSTYWIEVSNNLADFDDCNFWWWQLADGSQLGNRYSVSALGSVYVPGSEMRADMAFCLEDDFAQPETPIRACCTCDNGLCQDLSLFDCIAINGKWQLDISDCATGGNTTCDEDQGPPDNDECVNMELIPSVPFRTFTNSFCATTDGFNPILSELGSASMGNDVWFEYTPAVDCLLTVSMCATGTSYDSFVGLYWSGTEGDPVCQCPVGTDIDTHLLTFIESNDEGCTGELIGGPGIITAQAKAGTCYLIRAGGFLSQGNALGIGSLDISCESPPTAPTSPIPDPYSPGALACGGGDNYGLACETCDAGSRAGLTCLTSDDCPSGICKSNDALCPDATCGGSTLFTYPKSRFIGFQAPTDGSWDGKQVGVRVVLANIGPNASCNGQIRYAGEPALFCEGGACDVNDRFWASKLQATPVFRDWSTLGSVQLYGEEVVSDSRFAIQAIEGGNSVDNEANFSMPVLLVDTAKWGDVVTPLSGFTSAAQPSISDVLQLVDKWLGNLEPRKSRTLLQPGTLNVSSSVGIADVLRGVDAWLGTPYPFTITTCP